MGRIYNALDRFLPFDRFLDPMFSGQPPMVGARQVPQGVMGFPAVMPLDPPRKGDPAKPKVSKLRVLDRVLGGGMTFSDAIDAERARPQIQADAERRRQDALAFAATLPPQERMVFMSDPEAWAKSRAKGYEPNVVAQGSSIYTGDRGFQQAPLGPQKLGPGDTLFDPQSNRTMITTPFKPEVVTTNPGQGVSVVTPGRGAPSPDDIFGALVQQESGGSPGVTGPQTPYGQAQGATQMLPQTAQAMAAKLNLPWRPDLMTGTSPEAEQYQHTLGRAYFDEGLQRYGGDPRKALMYYHGGPDESLWGPKTAAYADAVMGRLDAPSSQVVSQGAPTGFRPATAEDRQRWGLPEGIPFKVNVLTGEPEAIGGLSSALPKPPPSQVVTGYSANQAAIKKIDTALAMLSSAPQAVGIVRGLGDTANQRFDPGGVEARQAIMDIAGQIMSDRSGASVPAAEMVRLEPYLPQVTDTADTVRKKLAGLKRELESTNSLMEYDFPSLGQPGAGQRGSVQAPAASSPAAPPRKPPAAPAAPPRRPTADPLRGIAEGQVVIQGSKRYRRQGNQMVEVR